MLFFFNDTATTEIYTLSLHDALPIYEPEHQREQQCPDVGAVDVGIGHHHDLVVPQLRQVEVLVEDRKSTRLNSSHANISYAVFCLKKKRDSSSSLGLPVLHYLPT